MKKISTLVAVLAVGAMTVANAATRTWDFTKWSDTTVANLKAGSDWSDIEKADGTAPTEVSKDNCFWQVNATADLNADKYLMANDVVIEELKGLVYTNTSDRSFAIAVNYPEADASKDFGPYKGGSYIWFGGSKKDYFIIPAVKPGSVIKMGVESHKITNARGVQLYIGAGHEGTKLLGLDGQDVADPMTYEDQAWQVPADLTEATDIQIYNTNGCHIYYITVESPSATEPEAAGYYAVGGFQSWNPEEATEFTYADGIYTLEAKAAEMKISTVKGNWDTFNAGTIGVEGDVEADKELAIAAKADYQFKLPYEANWTVTIDAAKQTIKFVTSDPAPTEIAVYLRGGMNNWEAQDAWKFSTTDDNVYTLAGVSIAAGVKFKVASEDWSTVNFGGENADVAPNTAIALASPGTDMKLAEDVANATLTFNLAEKTLLISTEGGAVEAIESAGAVEYFNLQGVRVANPEKGVYIMRQGGKAVKVVK